jgi:large conductance mechanosensitive channel
MLKEFKDFIMRGNVLDLAVAVILGGAFGKIVSSAVNDVLMPPLGLILGKVDFSNLYINLSGRSYASLGEAQAAGAATVKYGVFLNNVIDFGIVSLVVFLIVRFANRLEKLKKKGEEAPKTKNCPYCISVIPLPATRCPFCTSELKSSPLISS